MKRTQFFALLLALAVLMTACGGAASESRAPAEDMVYAEVENAKGQYDGLSTTTAAGSSIAQTNRKLIKTVNLNAETEHFDDLMTALEEQIVSLGGYVESRESRGQRSRYCSMTIRIPAQNLGSFVGYVTENANVLRSSETTEDITLQYVDTEAKVTALETEQARLLELLESAQNLTEVLEIEARLSDVTYELERYASQMRTYDNLVDYATVHLSVDEVEVLTPVEEPTVWERITEGFGDSLDELGTFLVELFIFVVAKSPYLLIIVPIAAFVVYRFRKNREKTKKYKNMPPEKTE